MAPLVMTRPHQARAGHLHTSGISGCWIAWLPNAAKSPGSLIHCETRDHIAALCGECKAGGAVLVLCNVGDLPAVIAVPQQYALRDRLHVGRGQLLVRLRGKQTPLAGHGHASV